MLGSFGPKAESQTALTPWEEAPSGMLARGHYTVKSKFVDDDSTSHLDWEWSVLNYASNTRSALTCAQVIRHQEELDWGLRDDDCDEPGLIDHSNKPTNVSLW